MKQTQLFPQYVDLIPEQLSEGHLYICNQYKIVVHKCCCGCGEEVITPLSTAEWSIRNEGNAVTLHPSIGNWSFKCLSHYWIRKNQVIWVKAMSEHEIKRVRDRDIIDKAKQIASINQYKKTKKVAQNKSIFKLLCMRLITWIKY